ncbi:TPA: LPXTG cell wall anchor domain-containing protein [Streptococcus suis]|nr:LPXTG cell wall anchor domain-containing protein [Streptococcus suis]HEM3649152.1 LPXTG cell wall anchor domain-containing protein [Streptococcus suis]
MKKSSLVALMTLSSLVLNQATVLANESDTPVDSSVTVPINAPEAPTEPEPVVPPVTEAPTTEPVLPTEPVTPPTTEPVVPPVTEVPTTEPGTTTEPVLQTDPNVTTINEEPKAPEDKTVPKESEAEKPVDNEEPISTDGTTAVVPTIDGGTATITTDITIPTNNPNISAQAAQNAGASQVGTTSRVTGQVVSNVSQDAPITTHTGYQIISTVNSQVVIQGQDGTVSTVAAEVVGGKVNADKTISIKTASGEMTTLPSTGEKENLLMSLTGLGLLSMVGHYLKKRVRQAELI